ncbi:hypothetical protein SKAU_G00136200 [Synaphobranchus kaupii]|uniref:Reverse transcriptase domain-containing protein n=1 Tax=Synaphobranchus kaupii TaxID=118154 RepID=A0A9Q1J2V0_SYNKA|nr:hypothetical protein SKAU_G00136200 [Synaphobranchus kaupii]
MSQKSQGASKNASQLSVQSAPSSAAQSTETKAKGGGSDQVRTKKQGRQTDPARSSVARRATPESESWPADALEPAVREEVQGKSKPPGSEEKPEHNRLAKTVEDHMASLEETGEELSHGQSMTEDTSFTESPSEVYSVCPEEPQAKDGGGDGGRCQSGSLDSATESPQQYVRASIKYEQTTLVQLGGLSHKGFFNLGLLDSFPELREGVEQTEVEKTSPCRSDAERGSSNGLLQQLKAATEAWQVLRALQQVNPRKAAGPDGVAPRVLKACAEQLAGVYTDIFNRSLTLETVPQSFKSSVIVPVPKKPNTSTLNDFRPVALTSVAMKCLEKLVLQSINTVVSDSVDPLQFAYCPNRSVDDAVALALHSTLEHLDKNRTYVRMLFLDYSSAFNTIRPMKLIVKLTDLGVPTPTCNWILDFLTDRPQVVRMGNKVSGKLTISTGTPQGCCLSPKLFSLYTTQAGQKKLQRVIKSAEKIIGSNLPSMDKIYTQRCRRRAQSILKDQHHPAHSLFKWNNTRYTQTPQTRKHFHPQSTFPQQFFSSHCHNGSKGHHTG